MSTNIPAKEKVYKKTVCLRCNDEFSSLIRAHGTWDRLCRRCHRANKEYGSLAGTKSYFDEFEVEQLHEHVE